MKKSGLIFVLILPLLLNAQDLFPLKHGEKYRANKVAPLIHAFYNENDYVISFRVLPGDTPEERSDYFVLTKKGSQISAFRYLEKSRGMQKLTLPEKSLDLVWNTFVQNELFSIQNEEDIPNFCLGKYQIYNSHTYEFVILAADTMKKLTYYDPEYYDKACYGMPEREKNSQLCFSYKSCSWTLGL